MTMMIMIIILAMLLITITIANWASGGPGHRGEPQLAATFVRAECIHGWNRTFSKLVSLV